MKKNVYIIDICMVDFDCDEIEDMENFLVEVMKVLKVLIMIDLIDENVMEWVFIYI